MEYIYAALILNETDAEINEENLTAVLDAAGVDVEESRVKALVAALEDVDIEDAIEQAAAVPAAGGAAAPAEGGDDSDDSDDEAEAADEGDDDEEEEDEEASGEGLGSLFG
ncbi:50S ribosomal protein P1 [Haladaptatus sp. DJG-WS-42]|uniref:50S ribosomal protein P1 n=1 Tax=Haladaptatus sp. DJG-WS-42 TaxID=3120516 RepID=UPI0030D2E84B